MRIGLGLPLLLSAHGAALAAAPPAPPPVYAPSTATIAEVFVERVNVFDPRVKGEDWWPFRVANKLHILTQEPVVRRELLVGPGDLWDALAALESERNLRGFGFFRKAEIRPQERPDGKLDLHVRTQDAWTTALQFSAGTEGGEHFFIWGAEENNVLGRGKHLGFFHSQVGRKKRNELTYIDPRFLGTRFRLSPTYVQTDRGDSIGVDLTRPFFSLATPYALGASWNRTIDEETHWRGSDEISKWVHRDYTISAAAGYRLKRDSLFVQRVETGWYIQRDRFEDTDDTRPNTRPADRELSGPVLGYSWVQPRYIKETYVNRMERVEDFNLGNEFSANAGYMGTATGSDRDRWIYNLTDQQGLYLLPGRFALAQVGVSGRMANGRPDNSLFFGNLNLFWKTTWLYPQTWIAHFEGSSGLNLDGENQIILGGNTGLRGYRNNAFTGGRAILINFENRFFFPGEVLHLMRFGGAAFLDSGAVVPEHSGLSFRRFRTDVGAGLRISSTRSRGGNIVRVDVAYALNDGPGRDRWVVTVRGRQAFEIFNSATKRVRASPGTRLNNPGTD